VIVAVTGSQQTAVPHAPAAPSWATAPPAGPIVGASVGTFKIEDLRASEPEEIAAPVVNVPTGLSLRQARSKWKKAGAPLPEDIVVDAPYAEAPRESVVDFARNFKGAPYAFTGSTPYGFDCSGYVRFIYSHFGLLLPHSARDQADHGTRIKAKHAKPGDLVVWNNGSHTAIYVGDGRIIHATKPGQVVSEVDLYTDSVFYVRLPVGTSK